MDRKPPLLFIRVQHPRNDPALHHDAVIGKQRDARVVRHKDENFPVLAQQLQGAGAMDARVLDLVQQHDGRVADDRGVGNQQRARLAAGKFRHPAVNQNRFAGQLIGKSQGALQRAVNARPGRAANPGMGLQKFPHRKIGEKGRVLGNQGDGVAGRVIAIFRRRPLAIDQNPPAGRRIGVGKQLNVIDQRRFAGPGRPDDADHVAHAQINAVYRFLRA